MEIAGVIISEKGQMLLVVVLVMVVALTVGLSVAARSITSTRVTSEEENSERAFSAAEAGLERSIAENTNVSGSFTGNSSSYTTTITQLAGQYILLENGTPILKDNASDVWLSSPPAYANPWSGNVTIYWGSNQDVCAPDEAANSMAALDIVLISGTYANPIVSHYPTDPCPSRQGLNNFASASGGGSVNGTSFAYSYSLTVNSGLLMAIMPLYTSTPIGLAGCLANGTGCASLPSQASVFTSIGTSSTATRKVVGIKPFGTIPTELFPFSFFSP